MTEDPPNLTIAASNDEAQLLEERGLDEINWAVRDFMANWLRVMRGAGRPNRLLHDLNDLVKTIRELEGVSVYKANEQIAETLRSALSQDLDDDGVPAARESIARGALQMLASELVGQTTQKRAGESELTHAVRDLQQIWEENRRQWQLQSLTPRPRRRTKVR